MQRVWYSLSFVMQLSANYAKFMSNHAERNTSDDSSPFRKNLISKHEENVVIGDDT